MHDISDVLKCSMMVPHVGNESSWLMYQYATRLTCHRPIYPFMGMGNMIK